MTERVLDIVKYLQGHLVIIFVYILLQRKKMQSFVNLWQIKYLFA